MSQKLRLGVNIDHIATLRNARGGANPCPIHGAQLAAKAGAHGITAHLREDRRHIKDTDIARLKAEVPLPLNFEMAATQEMQAIALKTQPNACCLVPEKREELTTEGGLNVANNIAHLTQFCAPLREAGIRISLFVDPSEAQIHAAKQVGADIIELHTGRYCELALAHQPEEQAAELERIQHAATLAHSLGIEVHAGHGLTYDTTPAIAAIPEMVELNIGHFLMGEAMFVGLDAAVKKMIEVMDMARS